MSNQNGNQGNDRDGGQGNETRGQGGQAGYGAGLQSRSDEAQGSQARGASGLGGRGEVDPLEAQELQDGAPGERSGSQNGSTQTDVQEVVGGETGTRQQGGGSQGEGMGDDNR